MWGTLFTVPVVYIQYIYLPVQRIVPELDHYNPEKMFIGGV